jgi:hypothetical protein
MKKNKVTHDTVHFKLITAPQVEKKNEKYKTDQFRLSHTKPRA